METEEIIAALVWDATGVPYEAIAAAEARQDEVVPAFIAEIEAFVAKGKPSEFELETSPILTITLLLGQWQAKAAYRPVCRLMRLDDDTLDAIFGDAQDELGKAARNLFDGDPQPIFDVILDPGACQYSRGGMFDALVELMVDGRLDRDTIEAFVRSAHSLLEPRVDNMVWDGWQNAVALLGMDDLDPAVVEAIEAGRVPEFVTDIKHFRSTLTYAKAHPVRPWPKMHEPRPSTPVIELLEVFHKNFVDSEERRIARSQGRGYALPSPGAFPDEPVTNPFRNVGRNDPCPCGSGKKFKKCCLGKASASPLV